MSRKCIATVIWVLWALGWAFAWLAKPAHEDFSWQFWLTGYSNFFLTQAIQKKPLYCGITRLPYPEDIADRVSYYFTAVIGWVIYLIAKFV